MPNEHDQESLRLNEVTRRFADSAETLGRVAGQLHALRDAESLARTSSESLSSASGAVQRFAEAAEAAAVALREASELASRALESSAALLQGSRLEEVLTQVRGLADGLSPALNQVEAQVSQKLEQQQSEVLRTVGEVAEKVRAIETKVYGLPECQAELKQAKAELERVKSTLWSWQRRKLGI